MTLNCSPTKLKGKIMNTKAEAWHRPNHTECFHPWYSERTQSASLIIPSREYTKERNWLRSLEPTTITQCLNGEPTTAEERLYTVEDILAQWYDITY